MTVADNKQFQEFIAELAKGMRGQAWFVGGVMGNGEIVSASNLPKDKQQRLLEHLQKSFAEGTSWDETLEVNTRERKP
jgi:hypothetical protein